MKPRLLVIGLLLFCSVVTAAQSGNLYRVEWPVADRSQSAYQQALLAAFKEVVVRASGTQKALDAFYVQESFKKLPSFIRTYQYLPMAGNDQPDAPRYKLVFHFDENAVRRLLQDAAVPMWSGSQPVTVMWLAYEDNFQRHVLSSGTSTQDPVLQSLQGQIERRGLPVILPLMDLEDELVVTSADIWGLFPEPILNASARYGSDAIFAGRLVNEGNRWSGRFLLNVQNQQWYQELEAESSDELLQQAIDWLGEALCNVYCVTETFTVNQWRLLIQDVGSFYSYRKLMDYLESLSAIRRVELAQLKGRSIMVNVDLVGDVDSLIQAIELDRKLIPETDTQQIMQAIEAINSVRQSQDGQIEAASGVESSPEMLPRDQNTLDSAVPLATLEPQQSKADPLKNLLVYYWRP
jgi:hypothetical protein